LKPDQALPSILRVDLKLRSIDGKQLLDDGVVKFGVIGGKDGWLFLHEGERRQFAYLSGEIKVDKQCVTNMEKNTLRRLKFCKDSGARYLNIIMPAKPVCCEKTIPSSFHGRISSLYLRYFLSNLSRDTLDVTVYPIDELLGEKNFKKLDTHLNDAGNFKASKALLNALEVDFNFDPSLDLLPNRGDLSKMIGEPEAVSIEPTLAYPMIGLDDFDNKVLLQEGTNTGHMRVIKNTENITGRKLLICGDSFSVGLLPFLARCFNVVFYVRGPIFPYDALKFFKPTHVISSSTERYLSAQIDDEIRQSPFSSYQESYWYDPSHRVCTAFDSIFNENVNINAISRRRGAQFLTAWPQKNQGKDGKMTQAANQVEKTIIIHKPARLAVSLNKATIVICGSQRGKTSAVAYALYNMGLFLGDRIGEKNYEDADILSVLPDPSLKSKFVLENLQRIVEIRNKSHDVWGFKIPHASGYIDELSNILRNPVFVIVFRNPVSVMRSICNRETARFDIDKMLRVAARPIEAAKRVNTTKAPAIFVDADELDRNPEIFVQEISKALQLEVSATASAGLVGSGYKESSAREDTSFLKQ
jgi:hypothetical protein